MTDKSMKQEVKDLQKAVKGLGKTGEKQEKRIDYIQSMETKQGRSIGGIKATYLPRIRGAEAKIRDLTDKYNDHDSELLTHTEGLGEHEIRLNDHNERLRLLERNYFERTRDALVSVYNWFIVAGDVESVSTPATEIPPTAEERPGYMKRFLMGIIGFEYVE